MTPLNYIGTLNPIELNEKYLLIFLAQTLNIHTKRHKFGKNSSNISTLLTINIFVLHQLKIFVNNLTKPLPNRIKRNNPINNPT